MYTVIIIISKIILFVIKMRLKSYVCVSLYKHLDFNSVCLTTRARTYPGPGQGSRHRLLTDPKLILTEMMGCLWGEEREAADTYTPVYKGRQRGHYKEPAPRHSSPHVWPSPPSSSSPPAVSAGVPGKTEMCLD